MLTYLNLWTLLDHPAAAPEEWTLSKKIDAVAQATFDGVMGEPGEGIGELAKSSGLKYLACSRLGAQQNFHDLLKRCQDEEALVAQIHLGEHDTPANEALELALRLDAAAREIGLDAVIETHRDTCTETPEKTLELQSGFRHATQGRELPMVLDFSHHAVVKHLYPPYAAHFLTDIALIHRTRFHHLRPFNGHHAQIPVLASDGSFAPEMTDWLTFADEVLRLIDASQQPDIWICPELGPLRSGYGLSAFPPSWDQALALNAWFKNQWDALRHGKTQTRA